MSSAFFINKHPVEVIRKKVIRFRLALLDDNRLRLSAPLDSTNAQIRAFLNQSASWLEKQLAKKSRNAPFPGDNCFAQGKIFFWGKEYLLALHKNSPEPRLEKKADIVNVYLPEGETCPRYWILDCYIRETAEKLNRLIPLWLTLMDLPPIKCAVRVMKSRWGSCTMHKKSIRINAWLAAKPPECLELVLVHELCHFFEKGHGPKFYQLLGECLPDWKQRRQMLANRGS